MKLYFFPVAPNPTRVRLYLAEKAEAGGRIELEEVVVKLPEGEQRTDAHLLRNPLGRLPVLEFDDGTFLTESLVIMDYLESVYPEPPLVGKDPRERARVRELERQAEIGVLHPIAQIVHSTNSPLGRSPNPAMAEHFRSVLPSTLKVLDDHLADGRPFIAGDRPTIADCTLAASLQFGRFGKFELPSEFENLARWDAAYRERPAVKAVLVM